MRVPIGEMRDSCAILTPVVTKDDAGGDVITYDESDPIFLLLRGLSTREAAEFGQINSSVNFVCYGHYHDLCNLSSLNRIQKEETGQTFDIVGLPINSHDKDWTRLNLTLRENG